MALFISQLFFPLSLEAARELMFPDRYGFWLLGRICGSLSWHGSITLEIASLYVPSDVSSVEVEKPSTGASSLLRSYFDRFALKNGTREEAPVLRCCMLDVSPPTNSAEEPFVHYASALRGLAAIGCNQCGTKALRLEAHEVRA